jgi:hypothetical protein
MKDLNKATGRRLLNADKTHISSYTYITSNDLRITNTSQTLAHCIIIGASNFHVTIYLHFDEALDCQQPLFVALGKMAWAFGIVVLSNWFNLSSPPTASSPHTKPKSIDDSLTTPLVTSHRSSTI